ncbi:CU044_5270 family protein [Nonomuraea sp. NPDC001831]|uniref:CU044_5270 family protein n=1 Tax=Nonomuraea sp. NPDC001831 TaxID=3364340 RepID=UPI0036A3D6E7
MNDLERLREDWAHPAPPAPDAQAAARAALLARARRPRSRRRWAIRALAVAASAVIVTTGVSVFQGERTLPAAHAQVVLTRIAAAVQEKEFTPPRGDQWIYTESRVADQGKRVGQGERLTPQTPPPETVEPFWIRADGRRVGYLVRGKLTTSDPGERTPENTYALLASLPTDPDALLAAYDELYQAAGHSVDDEWIFLRLAVTLSQNLVPPEHEAAIFRAMAKLPGVTVDERATDTEGRPALSISQVAEGWRKVEILLDPVTYAYRARRETAITDHEERYPKPDGILMSTLKDGELVPVPPHLEWSVEKGTTWSVFTRVAIGVVDQAGERP